jgi:hypothetical protein
MRFALAADLVEFKGYNVGFSKEAKGRFGTQA